MNYSLHTLDSGLRVVFIPLKSTQAVTVLVLVKVGSRHETPEENGMSHFIEHMLFKGSKKRPRSIDISSALEQVGAEFNAFTGKEYTGYYVKSAGSHLPLAVDVLSDMLVSPLFVSKELERERGVIIEEINMYEDNPRVMVEYEFDSLLYKGNPLAQTIVGPKSVVSTVSRRDLLAYKAKHYTSGSVTIAVAGNVHERTALPLFKKSFAKLPIQKSVPAFETFASTQQKPRVHVIPKQTEQVHFSFGFPGFHDDDPRLVSLKLLSIILGGGMSSRLFVEAREKRGLCYAISSHAGSYEDSGDLMIKVGCDARNVLTVVEVICRELKKLKKGLVPAAELKKAKDYVEGKMILSLEDSEVHADWYAKELLYKKHDHAAARTVTTPEMRLAQFKKVTASSIQQVAKQLFVPGKVNCALIGPVKKTLEKQIVDHLKL